MVVDTVEIVSEKDPSQKSIINATDFNPELHTLWADRHKLSETGRHVRHDLGMQSKEAAAQQAKDEKAAAKEADITLKGSTHPKG